MSGGVDSSVAALLLARQGYDVVGISMRLWSYEREATHGCCTPDDLYDARKVAEQLGIPHYVNDFEETFEKEVVSNFVQSYAKGETPNPCVRCNRNVKFKVLLKRARELGATSLATGHYARSISENGVYRLLRAKDQRRDQSYFLFGIGQEELAMLRFPLGDLRKEEVRALAKEAGLVVAGKPDSQEICFVPGDYADFVEKKLSPDEIRKGLIVNERGETLSKHSGIHRYTVGQRKGLSLPTSSPLYVLAVHPSGKVMVGPEEELYRSTFDVRETHWTKNLPKEGEKFLVQIRSRFSPAPARLARLEGSDVRVSFEKPQRAITPGQAAVFYQGDELIGGGWISSVEG